MAATASEKLMFEILCDGFVKCGVASDMSAAAQEVW